MRTFAIRTASLAVLATLFLTGPALSPGAAWKACVLWTPLWGSLGFHLNCDSGTFLKLATDPGQLLGVAGMVWQSRPAYILLGAAGGLPIRALFPGLDWPVAGLAAAWWSYTALNFAILLLAIAIFDRLVGATRRLTVPAFVFGTWLLANDVVKQFLWTPHTQLFNVLVPVIATAVAHDALGRSCIGTARTIAIGLACGLAALAYGSFAVACTAFVASLWLRRRLAPEDAPWGRLVKQSACALGAFVLPIAAWTAYVRLRTGWFYSHEIASYRQFVWMLDAAQQGPSALAAAFDENLRFFLPIAASVLWLPAIALTTLVLLAWRNGVPLRQIVHAHRALVIAVCLAFAITAVFLALLGFYAERLSWALVPPLLVVCVPFAEGLDAALAPRRRTVMRATLILLLAAGIAVEVRSTIPPLAAGSPAQARAWAAKAAPAAPTPRHGDRARSRPTPASSNATD